MSPMAWMWGREVVKNSSVVIQPRPSVATPAAGRFKRSPFERTPEAMNISSARAAPTAPVAASSNRTTFSSPSLEGRYHPHAGADVDAVISKLGGDKVADLLLLVGMMRSFISSSVTFAPKAENMWANSAPMAPPPTMIRRFHGLSGNRSPKKVSAVT